MVTRAQLLERASTAQRESKYLDFKSHFDASPGAWCELIKDIVACANSGGGVLVFGANSDGSAAGTDVSHLLQLDTADITDKMARYTGVQFSDIELVEILRTGGRAVAMLISETEVPLVFVKPGTYAVDNSKQRTAFSQGTVYFRHGAKSEPGNREDLIAWRDRSLEKVRASWLGNIKKVVAAPADHAVTVVSSPTGAGHGGSGVGGATGAIMARVSAEPGALSIVPQNAEEIWPYRQKDLLREINKELPSSAQVNGHDMLCINTALNVLNDHPEFAYKPHRLASPQYSQQYAEWIVAQYRRDKQFFRKHRVAYRAR